MQIAGIIAEYDPFHNGHAWQLAEAKRRGAQTIIVAMSTGAVQRGSLPLLPEAVRVRAALAAGADLVLALPAPMACCGAEGFARAGVALLAAAGCDTLICGAETLSAKAAMAAARILESPEYRAALKAQLAGKARNFAAAREAAFCLAAQEKGIGPGAADAEQPNEDEAPQQAGKEDGAAIARALSQPNDNLAVEYARAILHCNGIALYTLPRIGAGHSEPDAATKKQGPNAEKMEFASASCLRTLWAGGGAEAIRPYVPEIAFELYTAAERRGEDTDPEAFSRTLLSRLRMLAGGGAGYAQASPAGGQTTPFSHVRGVSEGLDHALENAVHAANTAQGLYDALTNARYPRARMRRLCLDAALGFCTELPDTVPYLHVLGARRTALPLLRHAAIPADTSLAKLAAGGPGAAAMAAAESGAADFAALCRRAPGPMGLAYTQACILL